MKVKISTITKGIPITLIEVLNKALNLNLQNDCKVRDQRNGHPQSGEETSVKTMKEVVVLMPQPAMDKVIQPEVEQISDASSILGVVKIKHNY